MSIGRVLLLPLGLFAAISIASVIAAEPSAAMTFPGQDWQQASPASQGLDAGQLAAAVKTLEQGLGRDGVKQLLIERNGRIVWQGPDIDTVHGVWSATKSFTSTALGLLVEDRRVTLDTRAAELVPALADHYGDVTLRHFTTMTSGYRAAGDEPQGTYAHGPSRTPLAPSEAPLFTPPGSQYAYWDSAMNEFGLVLTEAAGEPLSRLFARRIAEPIGMDRRGWRWGVLDSRDGVQVNGGAGNMGKSMQISARQLARFGHLFLNRGRWNDRQLISQSWVAQATRVQAPADLPWAQPASKIDGRGRYGFNWWVNGVGAGGQRKWPAAPPDTFAAIGFNNNLCLVLPAWQMVVARTGLDGSVDDAVWNRFLGELGKAVQR
jgi:CubicO group peptidase (beta-lactamase class C family)